MTKETVTVGLPKGMESRPVAILVQIASQFKSKIYLECENKRVNAKSIMGVMMLAAEYGSTLRLSFNGKDEKEACSAITRLFTDNFNEEY